MLRSLFSGISGLRAHQQMMDVTANNIANVNTIGFKSSQTTFEDTLSQMVQAASAPQGQVGGTNPAQVGLGVRMAGITTNFGQGAAQTTGRSTDLMINGDGFFVVNNGAEQLYTRAGAFSFDTNGDLVAPDGAKVMGWAADATGKIDTNQPLSKVNLPIGQLFAPAATTDEAISGNLPADTTSTTPVTTAVTVYDSQGNAHTVTASFTKLSATSWGVTFADENGVAIPTTPAISPPATSLPVNFAPDGTTPSLTLAPPAVTTLTLNIAGNPAATPPWAAAQNIDVDISKLTNFAGASTVTSSQSGGSAMGSLQAFNIAPDGTLIGTVSNGNKQALAQLALAVFNNPPGLEKVGDSMFRNTVNSGNPQVGVAGQGGRGQLQGGALEMSNVDLAQEFTNLVIAQRGFEANSKVITTSDEILQDLVNLKR